MNSEPGTWESRAGADVTEPDAAPADAGAATPACTGPRCVVCPLSALSRGMCARVVRLTGAPRLRRRLMALGVRPSAELAVLGQAPNQGPFELRAGTVHLMLRAHEAREVLVEVEDTDRYALPTV